MNHDIDPSLQHLPMTAQKLIMLVGVVNALRLIDAHGGTAINLYHSNTSLEKMAAIVGRDGAEKMLRFFGSDPFTVPTCRRAMIIVRNRQILREFDRLTMQEKFSARGAVAAITRQFTPHIHERTIWRILKTTGTEATTVDSRQMSLI